MMMMMMMILTSSICQNGSTQLSWDQQSEKNLSNSTDARAHSGELRIKVITNSIATVAIDAVITIIKVIITHFNAHSLKSFDSYIPLHNLPTYINL